MYDDVRLLLLLLFQIILDFKSTTEINSIILCILYLIGDNVFMYTHILPSFTKMSFTISIEVKTNVFKYLDLSVI